MAYQAPDVFQVGKAKELIQGCTGAELDHDLVTWLDASFWYQASDLDTTWKVSHQEGGN